MNGLRVEGDPRFTKWKGSLKIRPLSINPGLVNPGSPDSRLVFLLVRIAAFNVTFSLGAAIFLPNRFYGENIVGAKN